MNSLFKISIALIFSIPFIISCNNNINSKNKSILYTSGGRTSEVLVVISDKLWKSELGDSIKASLGSIPEWLSRAEPEYNVSQIPYNAFGSTYQKQRNILFVKIVDKKEPKIAITQNKYAKPQTYISIKANNPESLKVLFSKYKERIKESYHKNEITRIKNAYKGLEVKDIAKKIESKFGFSMVFPRGFQIASNKADFAWVRRPGADIEEGILIYTTPYSDTSMFEEQNIIDFRNEITKKHIPGPVDNSYMKVSSYFPPVSKTTSFKNHYATQLRSMWDVEGYPMGGPFISYTFVDSMAHRLITIDGYIKAPKKEKRDLILHLEAIMESFSYSEEK